MKLTNNQLDIMEILWDSETALSSKDIKDVAPTHAWRAGSIFHILNCLMEKEAIIVVGMQASGKVFGRTYAAKITREHYQEYLQQQAQVDKMKFIGLFSALLKENSPTNETLNELEQILADVRKDLSK